MPRTKRLYEPRSYLNTDQLLNARKADDFLVYHLNKPFNATITIVWKYIAPWSTTEERNSYHKAFLQRLRSWYRDKGYDLYLIAVKEFSVSTRADKNNGLHTHIAIHLPKQTFQEYFDELNSYIQSMLMRWFKVESLNFFDPRTCIINQIDSMYNKTVEQNHDDLITYLYKTYDPTARLLDLTTNSTITVNDALGLTDRGKRADNMTPILGQRLSMTENINHLARQQSGFTSKYDRYSVAMRAKQ